MVDNRIFPYTPKEAKAAGIERGVKEVNKSLPFPTRLRELRSNHANQPSQKELADEIGVAKPTISLYEVGENVPDAKTVVKLAKYYGVPTDYILCQSNITRMDVAYIGELEYEIRRLETRLAAFERTETAIMLLAENLRNGARSRRVYKQHEPE